MGWEATFPGFPSWEVIRSYSLIFRILDNHILYFSKFFYKLQKSFYSEILFFTYILVCWGGYNDGFRILYGFWKPDWSKFMPDRRLKWGEFLDIQKNIFRFSYLKLNKVNYNKLFF